MSRLSELSNSLTLLSFNRIKLLKLSFKFFSGRDLFLVLLLKLKEPLDARDTRATNLLAERLQLFAIDFCLFMDVSELLLFHSKLVSLTCGTMVLVWTGAATAITSNLGGRYSLALNLLL